MKNIKQNGVQKNDIITIEFFARMQGGLTVLSSEEEGPLKFTVGQFKVVSGFNDAVIGMKVGESKKFSLNPEEAFGVFDKKLIKQVSLLTLPMFIRVGQSIVDGANKVIFNIVKVDSDQGLATLDGNHIFAGEKLDFYIRLKKIEKPNLPKQISFNIDELFDNHFLNYVVGF